MSAGGKPAVDRLSNYLYNRASAMTLPLSGTFELTPMCNFKCRMCYVRKSAEEVQRNERPMMKMEQWLKIAEEAKEQGMLFLLLTGGEPTLWPGFWELYERLCRMGLLVSINTNGSMLDEEAIEELKKNPPRRINITLYGASDETYEKLCQIKGVFSRVDRAICKLKEAGITVKLNCSLTPYNAGDLEKMVAYAKEKQLILDVATYMFPPLRRDESRVGTNERFTPEENAYYRLKTYELQYGEERYQNYLKDIKTGCIEPPGLDEGCVDPLNGKVKCRAGSASYWITWDGWMMPCGMMTSPRVDCTNQSFHEAWRETVEASEKIHVTGVCAGCANLKICHACAAMSQTETGNTEGVPVYLCKTVREMKRIAERELASEKRTAANITYQEKEGSL